LRETLRENDGLRERERERERERDLQTEEKEKEDKRQRRNGFFGHGSLWGKISSFVYLFVIPIEFGARKACGSLEIFLYSNSRLIWVYGFGFKEIVVIFELFMWAFRP